MSESAAWHLWGSWSATEGVGLRLASESMERSHELLHQASVEASLPGGDPDVVKMHDIGASFFLARAHKFSDDAADRLGVRRELVWGVVATTCAHHHADLELWRATVRGWPVTGAPVLDPDPNQGYE